MKAQIVRKIRAELTRGITSECQVVYLLVQIRKLMDTDKSKEEQYRSLKMYSDWVVHIKLSGPTAKEIVRKADRFYPTLVNGQPSGLDKAEFAKLFSLDAFREELGQFLTENRLSKFSNIAWKKFLPCFLNVIEDCSLVWENPGSKAKVDEVVIIRVGGKTGRIPDGTTHHPIWALCSGRKLKMVVGGIDKLSNEITDAIDAFVRKREHEVNA